MRFSFKRTTLCLASRQGLAEVLTSRLQQLALSLFSTFESGGQQNLCLLASRYPNAGHLLIRKVRLGKYVSSCFVGMKDTAVLIHSRKRVLLDLERIMEWCRPAGLKARPSSSLRNTVGIWCVCLFFFFSF